MNYTRFIDTIGLAEYVGLRSVSEEFADVILIFFSIVDRESFDCVRTKWIIEVTKHCKRKTPMILVGSKLDLIEDQNLLSELKEKGSAPVSYKEGCKMAKKIGALCYMQCSAKDDIGVNEIFDAAFQVLTGQHAKNKQKCVIF